MAEEVPGWLERILLPQLSELKGQIREIKGQISEVRGEVREVRGEVRQVNGRVESLAGRMVGEFKAVHTEIQRLDEKISTEVKRLDSRLDGIEENRLLEGKISNIESRLVALEARK